MRANSRSMMFFIVICFSIIVLINCFKASNNINNNAHETTIYTEYTEPTETIETKETEPTEVITEPTESPTEEPTESKPKIINLGEFRLTAYCNCKECCGKWAGGATASGVMPVANHTIAVDTDIIPFGTKIIINGITYVAEDVGSAIYGNRIDIYFDTHQETVDFGVQYADVYMVLD